MFGTEIPKQQKGEKRGGGKKLAHAQRERDREREREKENTYLVVVLSPVNHKGLHEHQGWKHMSTYLLIILHKSYQTAKFFQIHELASTQIQNKKYIYTQASNTNFQRNGQSDINLVKNALEARTH